MQHIWGPTYGCRVQILEICFIMSPRACSLSHHPRVLNWVCSPCIRWSMPFYRYHDTHQFWQVNKKNVCLQHRLTHTTVYSTIWNSWAPKPIHKQLLLGRTGLHNHWHAHTHCFWHGQDYIITEMLTRTVFGMDRLHNHWQARTYCFWDGQGYIITGKLTRIVFGMDRIT